MVRVLFLLMSEKNKDLISREGGIELIMKVMKENPSEAKLQSKGCGALRNIGRNHEKNRQKIIEAGGMQLVMKAIRSHSDSSIVQSEGCRTLYGLARSGNYR